MRVIKKRKPQWKRILGTIAAVAAVGILVGCYNGNQRLVEEVYTVQEGDTLWDIASVYMEKNTGGKRWIREFQQGIIEHNPEMWFGGGAVYPGQKIKITYWVAAE